MFDIPNPWGPIDTLDPDALVSERQKIKRKIMLISETELHGDKYVQGRQYTEWAVKTIRWLDHLIEPTAEETAV